MITRGARLVRRLAMVIAATSLAAAPLAAAGRYLPSLKFRTVTTAHFLIYYHQGEEQMARRLAGLAEEIHTDLTTRLRTAPLSRTHVVLINQNDTANGWATPLPYNTIEIDAVWPAADDLIANTDDWLRLVLTHEYVHILQLERSAGFAGSMRRIFGRSPLAFSNLFLPAWQVEGLATFEESATTGRGRLSAGSFRAIVDEAARAGRPEPLDRAGGDQAAWPSALGAYAYGGSFHDYLARRFGEEKLAELLAASADRFYFLQAPAFRSVFGRSLGDLWRDFEADRARTARPATSGSDERATRVTFHGFIVSGPRFLPAQRTSAARSPGMAILYSLQDAHDFPSLRRVAADGSGDSRLASRFLGERLGVAGDRAWFSQVDLETNVALRSDLYVLDLLTGRVTRATRDGRFLDPDVSPDGRAVVSVLLQPGRRALAILDVGGEPQRPAVQVRRVVAGDLAQYASPRWSPDGRYIVAARMGLGEPSEIVVVRAEDGSVVRLVSSDHGRNVAPTWTPDGRTVVFASDRDGGAFNLFAVDIVDEGGLPSPGPVHRITGLASGASQPDVSPDGRQLVYVGYTPAGYDLFTLPLDRSRWTSVSADEAAGGKGLGQPATAGPTAARGSGSAATESAYSPVSTLLPRYWLPTLEVSDGEVRLGAETGTTDVLARHGYSAAVSVRFARPDEGGFSYDGPPDWSASYVYDRWRPSFFVAASDATSLFTSPERDPDPGTVRSIRDREWLAGVSVPFVRVRHWQVLLAEMTLQQRTLTARDGRSASRGRNAARLAWSFNTSKRFGYSISPEQGVAGAVTTEHVRRGLGADGNADQATAELRGYVRLGARHAVLASRVGIGLASGDSLVRRVFYLGGAGPAGALVDFGSGAFGLLRGFDGKSIAGRRLATLNLEYRMPVVRIERGRGTWPFFAHTLHAAAFLDAGNAFDGAFRPGQMKRALGAELSLDVVLGYTLPLTCTAGVAFPHDPARAGASGASVYVRLGHSF